MGADWTLIIVIKEASFKFYKVDRVKLTIISTSDHVNPSVNIFSFFIIPLIFLYFNFKKYHANKIHYPLLRCRQLRDIIQILIVRVELDCASLSYLFRLMPIIMRCKEDCSKFLKVFPDKENLLLHDYSLEFEESGRKKHSMEKVAFFLVSKRVEQIQTRKKI